MHRYLLDWLVVHYGQEKTMPGLERTKALINPLLDKFKETKIITIAGTNGKGETTLWLSQYLKTQRHCAWISPHIQRLTERFLSENGEITESELSTLIHRCHQQVQDAKLKISFYEFLFFVFCTWASRREIKYLLLEVGMGGRLDSVNVFDADLLLLPSISRDHQEFLGNRYDLILGEKLALLRKNTIFMSYLSLNYLRERAKLKADAIGAKMIDLETLNVFKSHEFSYRNQLLAYAAYTHLMGEELNIKNWKPSLSFLENRGQQLEGEQNYLFFGSHNPDGLRKLIQFLKSGNYNFMKPPYDAVVVAFSQRSEKDLTQMLKMLKGADFGKVIVTTFPHPKSAKQSLMKSLCSHEGLEFAPDIALTFKNLQHQRLLVTGSYYFLGYFRERFCRQ